jgi:serine/threonine protein kinase
MDLPQVSDLLNGKYRITSLIGRGGMGSVYEARHEVLGTVVAIKFLDPDLAENPALTARFLQEARVSATVQSPHVTRVFDVERTSDGRAYLVMELLSGESLHERLARTGRVPSDEAIDIALQICAGLEAAHALDIVHRDLKPENVFLTRGGAELVKILDFGIAKLKQSPEFVQVETRPGSMMGTPAYMAPEQAFAADQVDARADVYSLGVILYEMLSGRRPVDDDEPSVIVERVMKREVTPLAELSPDLPVQLTDIVDRALDPNPDRRPQSAREVREALVAVVGPLSRAGRRAASLHWETAPGSVVSHAAPAGGVARTGTFINDDIAAASTVPRTLPPDPPGPPPIVPSFRVSPVAMPGPGGTGLTPSRRRWGWGYWVFGIVVLATLGAGASAYLLGAFRPARSSPPLLPAPPDMEMSARELRPAAAPQRAQPALPPPPPVTRSPSRPLAPQGSPQPTGAPPGVTLPVPTFPMPSSFPQIPGMPTSFPTTLPPFGVTGPAPEPRSPEEPSPEVGPASPSPSGSPKD